MLDTFLSDLQSNTGWFAINVLTPVALPFMVITAVAMATDGWSRFRKMLKSAVDGGQLYWVALGMLASTGYEAFLAYDRRPELAEFCAWNIGLCVLAGFFCSIFIASGTTRASQDQRVSTTWIWMSILMAVAVCFMYSHAHFRIL